jgi:hypothetical protein
VGGHGKESYFTASKQMCQEGMKTKDVTFVLVFCELVVIPHKLHANQIFLMVQWASRKASLVVHLLLPPPQWSPTSGE